MELLGIRPGTYYQVLAVMETGSGFCPMYDAVKKLEPDYPDLWEDVREALYDVLPSHGPTAVREKELRGEIREFLFGDPPGPVFRVVWFRVLWPETGPKAPDHVAGGDAMKTREDHLAEYRQMYREARESPEYWTRLAVWEFAYGMRKLLRERDFKQVELARALGVSEAYVSNVLQGKKRGISLLKMNEMAQQLDAAVHIYVGSKDGVVPWAEQPQGRRPVATEADVASAETSSQLVRADFGEGKRHVKYVAAATG